MSQELFLVTEDNDRTVEALNETASVLSSWMDDSHDVVSVMLLDGQWQFAQHYS